MKGLTIELKWAVVLTFTGLLWMVLERLVGLHDQYISKHAVYTNFVFIPFIILFALAIREKREKFYDGNMTWMEGFKSGFIVSIIMALLSPLAQWITNNVIAPDFFANAIAYGIESGQFDNVEEGSKSFNPALYMKIAPVATLFSGMLISAIVCIFVKRT